MSSDAPSERPRVAKQRKPGTKTADNFFSDRGPGKTSGRANKMSAKSREEARRDLNDLRSAFRPPKPDSLKVRLRKIFHPPYIPFTFVLLAGLSFTLVLAYAESWGRSQSRMIDARQAPAMAAPSGVTGKTPAYRNGATPRIRPAVFEKDGILYHVLTGPFASRSLAEKTCAEFAAAKQDCLVVKR
jgi:hypothetical protein